MLLYENEQDLDFWNSGCPKNLLPVSSSIILNQNKL